MRLYRWISLLFLPIGAGAVLAADFDPGLAGFEIEYRGMKIPYREFALYALPDSPLRLRSTHRAPLYVKSRENRDSPVQMLRDQGMQVWESSTPRAPGVYRIQISEGLKARRQMVLNLFVMRRYAEVKDGYLGEFRIGKYPETPLKNLEIYRKPEGFVEVTRANRDTRVSPHFTLGEFVSKQAGGYPKYVVLREKLLLKLEYLLREVNRRGMHAHSFHVMSGYRTPWYNAAIGNVPYSRHVYGGAADIFIDEDGDGVMDDLNGDGRSDVSDAHVLRRLVEDLKGVDAYEPYVGGLAPYRANPAHGPFLHIDVRGYRARWGHRAR